MTKPSGAKRHHDMSLPAKQQRGRQAFGGPARSGHRTQQGMRSQGWYPAAGLKARVT